MAGTAARPSAQELYDIVLEKIDVVQQYREWGLQFASSSPTYAGWVDCYRLDGDDKNPSAGIHVQSGVYNSFGGKGSAEESRSFFSIGMSLAGYPNEKACALDLARKLGIDTSRWEWQPKLKGFPPWFQNSIGGVLADAKIQLWLQQKPGISLDAVRVSGAKPIDWFGTACIGFPSYNPSDLKSPAGWMLYAADGSLLQVKKAKGQYEFRKSTAAPGSNDALLGCDVLKSSEVVWKMEGVTDWLAARSLGLPALSVTAGSRATSFLRHIANHFAGKTVFICHDADIPGQEGAKKSAEVLAPYAKRVALVSLPFTIEEKHGKDFRDWVCLQGTDPSQWHTKVDAEQLAAQGIEYSVPVARDAVHRFAPVSLLKTKDGKPDHWVVASRMIESLWSYQDECTLIFWKDDFWEWKISMGCYRIVSIQQMRNYVARFASDDEESLSLLGTKVSGHVISSILQFLAAQTEILCDDTKISLPFSINSERRPETTQIFTAFRNGHLNLTEAIESGRMPPLVAHSPSWFSPVCLPYDYDAEAQCPLWRRFLDETFDGDADFIDLSRKWFGYCLQPRVDEMRFLVLEGESKTGKSTWCHVLRKVLGEENVSTVPLELFGERFQIYPTMGKLANIVTEVDDRPTPIAEGMLKQYVGGDKVMSDRKNKEPVEFYPTAKLIFATNNRPRFGDKSEAIWNRVVLIPFDRIVPYERQDRRLKTRLEAELPGILNWAIDGAQYLAKNPFTIPDKVQKKVEEARADANPATLFLREHCRPIYQWNGHTPVSRGRLYALYAQWCRDNGHSAMASTRFGKEVNREFPTAEAMQVRNPVSGNRFWAYKGIVLENVPEEGGNGVAAQKRNWWESRKEIDDGI